MRKINPYIGSILLVAGCCIGAGMLSLPMSIISYGFFPSLIPLVFGWIYMIFSGTILLECFETINADVHLMGLFEKILGKKGKITCFILFSILFYSILTAYISGTSIIISDALSYLFQVSIPSFFSILLVGAFLYLGVVFGVGEVDWLNRLFMLVLFISYSLLMLFGIFEINPDNYTKISFNEHFFFSIPLFILSFGFQNLIPTLSGYLKGNSKKVFFSFFIGSFIALCVYLVFNFVIIGLLPEQVSLLVSEEEFLTRLFKQSPAIISFLVSTFSFFAILTSIITIAVSFVGFLSDKATENTNSSLYTLGVVLPPVLFALVNPNIFLLALRYGAGLSAVLLFGVLPSLALLKLRYNGNINLQKKLVPGGKGLLVFYLILSLVIVGIDLFS